MKQIFFAILVSLMATQSFATETPHETALRCLKIQSAKVELLQKAYVLEFKAYSTQDAKTHFEALKLVQQADVLVAAGCGALINSAE